MAGKREKQLTRKEKRKKDIKLIVQSNQLVEARYMFDTWEMRFFYSFVSMIGKQDEEDKVYRVWLSDVKKMYQLNNNDTYNQLRKAAQSLSDKSVYVWYEKDGVRREVKHRFIRCIDYIQEGQELANISHQEYIDVAIDKEMLPFLLYVKKDFDPLTTRYTSYDYRNILKLKPYDTRIFQLLKKDEYKGQTVLEFETLKLMFNIVDEYKRFSTFYQRILEPAFKKINKYTDIYIPLDEIVKLKKGRKIAAVRVIIKTKTAKEIADVRGESGQQPLFHVGADKKSVEGIEEIEIIEPDEVVHEKTDTDVLYEKFEETVVQDFGVTPTTFLRMLDSGKYTKEQIEQAIGVTRRAKFNQEIKKSVAGFFVKALKEGFTDIKAEQKKKAKKAAAKKEQDEKQKNQLETLDQEYAQKKEERLKQLLAEDDTVSETTLLSLKKSKSPALLARLRKLDIDLEMATVQDFRNDKILRKLFIGAIMSEYSNYFADIDTWYREQMVHVKQQSGEQQAPSLDF